MKASWQKAQEAIAKIDKLLATASTNREVTRIRDLATKKAEFERRLAEVENEWLELSSELEAG